MGEVILDAEKQDGMPLKQLIFNHIVLRSWTIADLKFLDPAT